MFENANKTKLSDNPLNENFKKKEFKALWDKINHKYSYTAHFDSDELIAKSIAAIDEKLIVSRLQYTTTVGQQKDSMHEHEINRGDSFKAERSRTNVLDRSAVSGIRYDLVGKIASETKLTRKTAATILKGMRADKLLMFQYNPEEFIFKVIRTINEQKAALIVSDISYNQIEGEYESKIFTAGNHGRDLAKAFRARKHIQDYVFTDGLAADSVEKRFAEDLDKADEVCVYAKLPRGFAIPTPVGNYSPDWAIAFNEGAVKHIYFIAETKGTMESLNLKPIEQAKIKCAEKLFNKISGNDVRYYAVDSYQRLLDVMDGIV